MREVTGDALERRVAQSLTPALTLNTQSPTPANDELATWRRLPVSDGVEIHVRSDSPAARDTVLLAMREAVRGAVGRAQLSD